MSLIYHPLTTPGARLCCEDQRIELTTEDNLLELIFVVENHEMPCLKTGFEMFVEAVDW